MYIAIGQLMYMLLVMYEHLSLNADSLCRTNVTCLSTLDPVLTSVNQAPSWRSVIGHHRCPALAELYAVGTVVRCDQWCLSLYSGICVNCMESIASDHFRSITAGACFDFFCVHKVSLLENMCVCIYVRTYVSVTDPSLASLPGPSHTHRGQSSTKLSMTCLIA